MFCVYGRSKVSAKKTVLKRSLNNKSEMSKRLIKVKTQDEKQSIIDEFTAEEFLICKVKRCTHEFSTPEIAKEAFEIMKKDKDNFGDIILMKKVNKLNANGELLVNKKSQKPSLKWVELN